ncbi:MAG: ester cyclase [Gemmatimonadales bacterium]
MSLDENKAVVQRILKEFWLDGNAAVLDELLASDCINHEQSNPELRGKAACKQWANDLRLANRQGFPDFDITVEDIVAEDDKVVKRWVFQGTHSGEYVGIPATGKRVTMRGITLYRLAQGRVSEMYWNYDVFGLLQQLGAIPAPEQQPASVSA